MSPSPARPALAAVTMATSARTAARAAMVRRWWLQTFPVLRQPFMPRYFLGQALAQSGQWLLQTALAWLAWQHSGSVLTTALVAAAGQLPGLCAPLGGVLADRLPRARLLSLCRGGLFWLALLLALMAAQHLLSPARLALAAAFSGLLAALETPTRQALLARLVENREGLGNAMALNALTWQGARLLAPPLAGLLLALQATTFCFVLVALCQLLLLTTLQHAPPARAGITNAVTDKMQLLPWLRQQSEARALLLAAAGSSLALAPFIALLPAYAHQQLGVAASGLGILLSVSAAGSLLGNLWLARRPTRTGLGTGWLALAVASAGLAVSHHPALAALWLLLAGIGASLSLTAGGIRLQWLLPDHLRGRGMGLQGLAYAGFLPVGSLLAGILASRLSLPSAFALAGGFSLLLAVSSGLGFAAFQHVGGRTPPQGHAAGNGPARPHSRAD